MKEGMLEIPFPGLGLDESGPKHQQRPGTSADLQNVRAFDPRTGRNRGGSRCGLSKYVNAQVNSAASIQCLDHLVTTTQVPSTGTGQSTYRNPSGTTSLGLVNSSGASYMTGGAAGTFECSCIDDDDNFYVVTRESSTTKVRRVGTDGTVDWTASLSGTFCYGAAVDNDNNRLYLAIRSGTPIERIVRLATADGSDVDGAGYWKSNGGGDLQQGFVFTDTGRVNNVMSVCGNYLGVIVTDGSTNNYFEIWNISAGTRVASVTLETNAGSSADVTTDGVAYFYVAHGGRYLKKVVAATGDVDWTLDDQNIFSVAFDSSNQRLVVCGQNLNGSSHSVAVVSITAGTITSSSAPGATLWTCIRHAGSGTFVLWEEFSTTTNQVGLASDLTVSWGPNSLGGDASYGPRGQSANAGPSLVAAAEMSPRAIRLLAVAGGTVKRVTSAGMVSLTGGSNAFHTTAPVVFSAQHGLDLYFADGAVYKRYKSSTDLVESWTPTAGSLPVDSFGFRAKLICTWRARIVLSGLQFDPQNWFMSAVNNALDWDYGPDTVVETQAVAGNNSEAGKVGDVIQCMIPYNDDVLIFGGDHTIWQMSGDPMAGGRIDLLTEAVGMAWGRPYAKDPYGGIWFFGSRGGVYRFTPGQQPERVSQAIEERLAEVNMGTHIVRMAWDDRQQGLYVFITSVSSAASATHYFYDFRNKAWFKDAFTTDNHNPKVAHVLDGDDPADRAVLLGSWDGYVRYVNVDADDDDGVAIASYAFLGPLQQRGMEGFLLKELQGTLATGSGTVTWSVHTGETAQAALAASAATSGTFAAGRNRSQFVRRHGHAIYVKLAHSTLDEYWALESLLGTIQSTGRVRQRIY